MANPKIPKLLFVGAGNIAQSVIKGILKERPDAADRILATAPTLKNLHVVREALGCQTVLLKNAHDNMKDFNPDFVFLCVKPQVLMSSIKDSKEDMLKHLLRNIPDRTTALSLLAGIKSNIFRRAFNISEDRMVRIMLNTAAEIGSTSVLYHASVNLEEVKIKQMESLLSLVGKTVVRLNDERLMDVATGICGSGIAFFYEMIQTFSDVGVKNGLNRADATLVGAQLSKAAGEMLLAKGKHPYQLRDEVTSPAGTTIFGLSSWHEQSTNLKISNAVQASIDRATSLSAVSEDKLEEK